MLEDRLRKILSLFEGKKGGLISIFQRVQDEYGYLPEDVLAEIAEFLKIPASQVFSVATFYAHFYLTRRGDHLVRICQGTACHVRGAREVLETAQHCLGIKTGETTEDYKFSLERVACVGSCANAPVVLIDDDVYAKVTPGKTNRLLTQDDKTEDNKQKRVKKSKTRKTKK
jgi:NADH:ubiquinone oxidoreductase subunit E